MSQTRVCDTPSQGDSSTRTAPELTQKLAQQGTLSRGPVEGTGRRVFPWPAAEPDRPATGVRSDKALEEPAPARTDPLGRHGWKTRFMPPWQDCHTFAIPAKGVYERASILVATNLPFRRVDRGLRLGASHRGAAGPAHPPRPHPGNERRKLPTQAHPGERSLRALRRIGRRLAHTDAVLSHSQTAPAPPAIRPGAGRLVEWQTGKAIIARGEQQCQEELGERTVC